MADAIWVLTNMYDGLFDHIQHQCLHSFIILWIHFFFGDWELEALQICCIFAEMIEKRGRRNENLIALEQLTCCVLNYLERRKIISKTKHRRRFFILCTKASCCVYCWCILFFLFYKKYFVMNNLDSPISTTVLTKFQHSYFWVCM